jgi:hypothetical protein
MTDREIGEEPPKQQAHSVGVLELIVSDDSSGVVR